MVDGREKFFSRNGCPAQVQYGKYLSGKAIRQEILETALEWIADRDDLTAVDDYMDAQKVNRTPNAAELWNYFESVFDWVEKVFPTYRGKLMKGLPWGIFYNKFSAKDFDSTELEQKISRLLKDKEVTNKRGIYEYLLSGEEKHLSLRQFDDDIKQEVYEQQGGICKRCGKHCAIEQMEADHITPWSEGGPTIIENCQLLCKNCNRRKSDK